MRTIADFSEKVEDTCIIIYPCDKRKKPGEVNGNLHQYSCLGNPRTEEPGRLQSRVAKELDMT